MGLLKTNEYSILTGSSTVSPTEVNMNNTVAEEYIIKYTTLTEENRLINKNTFKIIDEDTTTTSALKVQTENISETSTNKKNSVLLYSKLTTTTSSDLLNSDSSTNSKHNELTAEKQISNDKNTINVENLISYDTQPKSPYEATENTNLELNIEFYNATSDRKPTTKLIPIPILPWSANSILPESFQSVIAQLTEDEVTSPKNLFLDYTIQATPSININTFDAQNSSSDSDERVQLEFKSDNIAGYAYDNGQNESNSINELKETDNFNESDSYSYIETTFVSTVTLNTNSIDDSNKNTIPISNVSKGNVTNYEFSTKPTENYDSEISEMNFVTKFFDNKATTETAENSTDAFKNEEFEDTKSYNMFTKYSDLNNELLGSNFTLYNMKILFSTHAETYESTTAKSQDNSYQIDSKISPNKDLLNKDLLEIPNSSTSVHNQTWYDPLFNITELTTTWTEEMPTNNPPTIIQIINNHAGNNLSSILLSSTVKDINEPHVNTIAIQEHSGIKENITISPTVNNNLESSYDYYDFETQKLHPLS
ncbi:peptidase S1 domain-containing protein [Caerostris extrusa]|uniref:Peptidase S1 domain-containing protein n=1 Tax=Caerostris extrusa TaxID=172846 RepID=A0AAV4MPR7_CAEEX|nr:peptidase S1 domain-containing protein [Caerostris extrusa]